MKWRYLLGGVLAVFLSLPAYSIQLVPAYQVRVTTNTFEILKPYFEVAYPSESNLTTQSTFEWIDDHWPDWAYEINTAWSNWCKMGPDQTNVQEALDFIDGELCSNVAYEAWALTNFYPLTSNPSNYATEAWVDTNYYPLVENPSNYITEAWATNAFYPLYSNPSNYVSTNYYWANLPTVETNYYPLNSNPSNYISEATVTNLLYNLDHTAVWMEKTVIQTLSYNVHETIVSYQSSTNLNNLGSVNLSAGTIIPNRAGYYLASLSVGGASDSMRAIFYISKNGAVITTTYVPAIESSIQLPSTAYPKAGGQINRIVYADGSTDVFTGIGWQVESGATWDVLNVQFGMIYLGD